MKWNLSHPIVIAEIGINHNGDLDLAKKMIYFAKTQGNILVKLQCHIPEEEMVEKEAKKIIPPNADENIWDMMVRCSFTEDQEAELVDFGRRTGAMVFFTPFSPEAINRCERRGQKIYKIGSGESQNQEFCRLVAATGKPVILSTGMSSIDELKKVVPIFDRVPLVLMHCVSMYPTPYKNVNLGALKLLADNFPNITIGLSDHSIGIYTSLAGVALGAMVIEKHFTTDRKLPGPDNPISIEPGELHELYTGAQCIYAALGDKKEMLPEERLTANFAFGSIVSIKTILKGETFTRENIGIKRPGTGMSSNLFEYVLGHRAENDLPEGIFLTSEDIVSFLGSQKATYETENIIPDWNAR